MTGLQTDSSIFEPRHIIYSRSDSRGVVLAGNDTFQAISVYSWEELLNAPHKLLRHPDTPKGLFHMLWASLKEGQPLAAYIRNRAKDGSDYWVLATIMPIEGGYVSLRIKPTCGLLEKIQPIYDSIRAKEIDGTLTPEQSAAEIVEAVKGLGYSGYPGFMAFALRDELASRAKVLQEKPNPNWDRFAQMFDDILALESRAKEIETTFKKTHQIPYNMRLQAGRLETSDGPISIISANHRQMTQTLEDNVAKFIAGSAVGADTVRDAMFRSCVGDLIAVLISSIKSGASEVREDQALDLQILTKFAAECSGAIQSEIRSLSDNVRRFGTQCQDIRRMMSGLELTRIMCKIERSKFKGDLAGLDEIVKKLGETQVSLSKSFESILDVVSQIILTAASISRDHDRENEAQNAA